MVKTREENISSNTQLSELIHRDVLIGERGWEKDLPNCPLRNWEAGPSKNSTELAVREKKKK